MRTSLLFVLLISGCAAAPTSPVSAPATAAADPCNSNLIAMKATTEDAGLKEERQWIAQHYPGSKKGTQSLLFCGARRVDSIEITTAEGQAVTLNFEITGWYGKY